MTTETPKRTVPTWRFWWQFVVRSLRCLQRLTRREQQPTAMMTLVLVAWRVLRFLRPRVLLMLRLIRQL